MAMVFHFQDTISILNFYDDSQKEMQGGLQSKKNRLVMDFIQPQI